MNLWPTVREERWLTLAQRLCRSPRVAPFAANTGSWRTANLLSRCTFFVLGLIAAGMIVTITRRLSPTNPWVIAGIASIAAAEWLIVVRRQFWSGIEEALEAVGLTLLAFECWSHVAWHSAGGCFVGTALTIAGVRLLNPLFTTLGALAFVSALDATPLASGLVCYGVALAALMAGAYSFRRPSHDRMLDALVVVMPVAGYVWSAERELHWSTFDYLHGDISAWIVPLCSFLFGAIALITGLRRRAHPPLVSFMLCVACTAYELRQLTGLSLETRLLVWGSILLLVSVSVDRHLRIGRAGVTSRPLRDEEDSAGLLVLAGSAALTPHTPPQKAGAPFEGGGGGFAGGGASGKY
jgi:hypothetical protein